MKTINIIHIENETYHMKDLTKNKSQEIALQLNEQALTSIGYRKITKD